VAADKIRVLVVDDSALIRKIISDFINNEKDMEVIGTAKNGKEAIELFKEKKPDIVTLDIEMPVMDGLSTLREIMNIKPTPVIMLSNLTYEGSEATIKALELGAVDFISKPENIFSNNNYIQELLNKIRTLKNAKVFTGAKKLIIERPDRIGHKSREIKRIVAIGISTGGPRALMELLPSLPSNIPAAFLIVQHMPPGFTRSLAKNLDSVCMLEVKEAEAGEVLEPGKVYIAPGDFHMLVKKFDNKLIIDLTKDPPIMNLRPSANVLFKSLGALKIENVIAVIMTGMGSDGAESLKDLKQNGAFIIAQDETTSTVFGMPKSAIKTGYVDKVLPLGQIANEIIRIVEGDSYGC